MTGYILVENQTNLAFKDINLEFAEFEGVRKWQEPGEYGVLVLENDQPTFREVVVGLVDITSAEIVSGLQAGDVVTTGIVQAE